MIQHWFIHCVRCHLYAWMIHRSVLNGLRKKNKTKKPKKNPTRQTFPWKWYCTDWKWVKKQTAHREIQPDCTALGWIRKSMVILALLPQYLTSQILLILNRRTFLHSNTKILWWAYQGWSNGICNWDRMFTPTSMQTTVATLLLLVLSF